MRILSALALLLKKIGHFALVLSIVVLLLTGIRIVLGDASITMAGIRFCFLWLYQSAAAFAFLFVTNALIERYVSVKSIVSSHVSKDEFNDVDYRIHGGRKGC